MAMAKLLNDDEDEIDGILNEQTEAFCETKNNSDTNNVNIASTLHSIIKLLKTMKYDMKESFWNLEKQKDNSKNKGAGKDTAMEVQLLHFIDKFELNYAKEKGINSTIDIHERNYENILLAASKYIESLKEDYYIEKSRSFKNKTKKIFSYSVEHAIDDTEDKNIKNQEQITCTPEFSASLPVLSIGEEVFTANGVAVRVYKSCILQLKVDVIVNAADTRLTHDAQSIVSAAGEKLEKECEQFLDINVALHVMQCLTTTAGNLSHKGVIHTVGPCWDDYSNKSQCACDLARCIYGCIREADSKGFHSLAIPDIGSGIFKVPLDVRVKMYVKGVEQYLWKKKGKESVKEIHFVDDDDNIINCIQQEFLKQKTFQTVSISTSPQHPQLSVSKTPWSTNTNWGSVSRNSSQGLLSMSLAKEAISGNNKQQESLSTNITQEPGYNRAQTPVSRSNSLESMSKTMAMASANEDEINDIDDSFESYSWDNSPGFEEHLKKYNVNYELDEDGKKIICSSFKYLQKTEDYLKQKPGKGNKKIENSSLPKNVEESNDISIESIDSDILNLLHVMIGGGGKKLSSWTQNKKIKCKTKEEKEDISKKLKMLQTMSKSELHCDKRTGFDVAQQVTDKEKGIYVFYDIENEKIVIASSDYEKMIKAEYQVETLGKVDDEEEQIPTARTEEEKSFTVRVEEDISYKGEGSVNPQEQSITNFPASGSTGSYSGEKVFTAKGVTIKVYKDHILHLNVDAIVNAANDRLAHGGGVAYIIASAAGYDLEKECQQFIDRYKYLTVTQSLTTTAGRLNYKGVIHAVGPCWHDYQDKWLCADDLAWSICGCITEADRQGFKSLAIPAISSGIFGVPWDVCVESYVEGVKMYLQGRRGQESVQEIHFVDIDVNMINRIQGEFEKQKFFQPASSSSSAPNHQPLVSSATGSTNTNWGPSSRNSSQGSLSMSLKQDSGYSKPKTPVSRVPSDPVSKGTKQQNPMSSSTSGKRNRREWTAVEEPSSSVDGKKYQETESKENCVICWEPITAPKKLQCGHVFCGHCIDQALANKPVCPTCGMVLGVITGNQPPGKFTLNVDDYTRLPGYERWGSISIQYEIYSGYQQNGHPDPGRWFVGITRKAFLPNNEKGQLVAKLLNVAFKRKLVFTIGVSRTTGERGVVTWNDIHHKTSLKGGPFGYPDPTYLERVLDELKAKGITEKDAADSNITFRNYHGNYNSQGTIV